MRLGGARSFSKDTINYIKRFNRNKCWAWNHVWKVKLKKIKLGVG